MSKTYTTIQGDLWDFIAYRELGSCKYMDKLIDANRQYVDVAAFNAGTVLTIPDIESSTSTTLPPWRR